LFPLLYQNSKKDANPRWINPNTNLDSSLQKTQVIAEFHAKVFPQIPRKKEAILSKTDYDLSKKINFLKKMKATLTCLTIGYNLASLVNAFTIPLMVDFLSSQVT
jgi:hypothetical protein